MWDTRHSKFCWSVLQARPALFFLRERRLELQQPPSGSSCCHRKLLSHCLSTSVTLTLALDLTLCARSCYETPSLCTGSGFPLAALTCDQAVSVPWAASKRCRWLEPVAAARYWPPGLNASAVTCGGGAVGSAMGTGSVNRRAFSSNEYSSSAPLRKHTANKE